MQGDVGGPVVYSGNQVGIISQPKCGADYSISTRVFSYVNWIGSVVGWTTTTVSTTPGSTTTAASTTTTTTQVYFIY